MKYPQLVSTRAVNAISDWLVSRLEQLGVEAPLIYSRLLLSLLHSSVQINDPIEFNNLETYLASRKGNKRNPPCDTDTLKKLTAVQCLMETVSSEQEIAKIENLVDELCEKLNDIEKQINSDEEEQHFQAIENILNTLAAGNNCITNSTANINNNRGIANINAIPSTSGAVSISISTSSINSNCNITGVKRTQSDSVRNNNNNNNNNSELEDPRKRYYSAFPALSKEMEDSFRITNRNTKALTWPVGKSSSLQIINNTNIINNKSELYNNTAGVKRKPKRRRNQAMSKGRTSYNIRKNSYSGNCSPTWDTDFEGSWEMGRDLIKEFIVKENSRNRSTSESAAYNTIANNINNDFVNSHEKRMKPMDDNEMDNHLYIDITSESSNIKNHEDEPTLLLKFDDTTVAMDGFPSCSNTGTDCIIADMSVGSDIMENEISSTTITTAGQNNFNIVPNKNDINIIGISDEGYSTHETLTSLSELDSSTIAINYTRRLYERDISNDEDSSTSMNLCANIEQQQYDFAQFKAKFNSSVEALWKNIPDNKKNNNSLNQENINSIKIENIKNINEELSSLPTSTTKLSSAVTTKKGSGIKKNLENFWTNYYNHHYDADKLNSNDNALCKDDIAIKKEYENEYFSMPTNFILQSGDDDNNNNITPKTRETARVLIKVPSGVFLQDSIWSDSVTNYDDDDSFYANVLKSSTYKSDSKIDNGSSNDDKDQINNYPINISKWSEGINGVSSLETVFIPVQSSITKLPTTIPTTESNDLNRKDLRENMLKNSYFYNNKQQQQQQQQQQFTNNNNTFNHNYTMSSLPSENIYYNTSASGKVYLFDKTCSENDSYHNFDQTFAQKQQPEQITLTNHSINSGFVEYSLIKPQINTTNIIRKTNNNNINIDSSTSSLYGNSGSSVVTAGGGIEEENLLTSDRTHFRPIKQSYADGYCFDISNNYDEINYKRSPSGYLHFDGDKYLEYTRSDAILQVDDDSSTATTTKGTTLFNKQITNNNNNGKNRRRTGNNTDLSSSVLGKKKKDEEFILKFRIKSSNEKCCQTDPAISGNNSEYVLKMTKGHSRYHINYKNHKYFNEYDDDEYDDDDDEECSSDDIESMETNNYTNKKLISSSSEINTNYGKCNNNNNVIKSGKLLTDNPVIDQWSMIEIGKKCLDNISINIQNNNTTNNSHTLWGLCPACNIIDTKTTIPANRLLKDELNIEADEIMSDLKYMQDLYIGGGGNSSDWDDDDDDTDFDIETIKDCDYYQSTNNNQKYLSDNFFIAQNNNNNCNNDNNNILLTKTAMIIDDGEQQQQKEMFYNVTKLITDFLKPENAKTLANVLVAGDAIYNTKDNQQQNQQYLNQFDNNNCKIDNEINNNNNKYYGGFWNTDEHNIWKQNDFKPIDNIFMRFNNNTNYTNNNNNNNNNFNIDTIKCFDDKLNWEFSNLSEIWHKNTNSPQKDKSQLSTKEDEQQQQQQQKFDEKLKNKLCWKSSQQYQIDNNLYSGEKINEIKHIDKMENDDSEILNKLDQKISENISQLIDKQKQQQQQQQEILKRKNENHNNISNEKQQQQQHLNQRQHHSQSLDDSVTMEICKNLNTTKIQNQNRFDRKRRHSAASQNIIITTTTTTINDIIKNNNSNNKIGYNNNNIVVGGGQININNNQININDNNSATTICGNSKNFFDNLIIGNNQNIEISTKDLLNIDINVDDNDNDNNNKNNMSPTTSATIITCKYWTTTLDSNSLTATATTTPHKTATFILDNKNPNGSGGNNNQWNRNFVVDSFSNIGNNDNDNDGVGIGGISINPSSILKHVALIARPLTR